MPPGETPPGEASTGSGIGPRDKPQSGWARGPLIAIFTVSVMCAAFFAAYAAYVVN